MRTVQRILILILSLSAGGALLTACDTGNHNDGKAERAGEQVDKAAAAAKERAADAYEAARKNAQATYNRTEDEVTHSDDNGEPSQQ